MGRDEGSTGAVIPGRGVGQASLVGGGARLRQGLGGELAAWLPALPFLTLVLFLLVVPAIWLIGQSLLTDQGWSLDVWAKTLRSNVTRKAIVTSLNLSALSATLSTLVGAPVAWTISRMATGRRAVWLALLNVAANFGGIGLAFAYLATLGRVGMVTLVLRASGIGFVPPRPASFIGLTLAFLYVNVPLYILLTIPAMGVVREEWWEAAQTSSATRAQFWRYVGLPLLAPFVAAGWLLIFTWSIGIYAVAYALAGAGAGLVINLLTLEMGHGIQNYAIVGFSEPAVYGVMLLGWATLALLLYRVLLRRALKWL